MFPSLYKLPSICFPGLMIQLQSWRQKGIVIDKRWIPPAAKSDIASQLSAVGREDIGPAELKPEMSQ